MKPSAENWGDLIKRPVFDIRELEPQVRAILEAVKAKGLVSIREYSLKFDGYDPDPLFVPQDEIRSASGKLTPALKAAINHAAENIERFHRNQQKELPVVYISKSIQCWQKDVAIDKVGFYIPGGSAPLFSTVLMLGIPARIAGCAERVLCTPAGRDGTVDPAVLYAADLCGIEKICRIGGVQAIGAMAYGIGGVPAVDKIFGPGNQYVTLAKQMVNEDGVAIDMPAGPSEVLVMADQSADPEFVAADLLSQAEHGGDSQVILLCLNEEFARQVAVAIETQLLDLPRASTAQRALANSISIVLDNEEEMMRFSNLYAPEHLIISLQESRKWAEKVLNAGSVFIGKYTPESAGDYASGTNHTLPTNGYARSYSGLNLQSFTKTIQFQEIQPEGLEELGPDIMEMAHAEGLQAHAKAVEIRMKKIRS